MSLRPEPISAATRFFLEALVTEHAWRLDHGRAASLAELYTHDGRLLGIGQDLIGGEAIAEWGARRARNTARRSRHVCTNLRFVVETEDRVRGTTIVTLYRHDGDVGGNTIPLMVGDYQDVMVRTPEGAWLFAERRFAAAFTSTEP